MGVIATHRVTHDAGRLSEGRARPHPPICNIDHRMRRCTGLRPSRTSGMIARRDDRERVSEKAFAHLIGDRNLNDFAGKPAVEFELSRHAADRSQSLCQ